MSTSRRALALLLGTVTLAIALITWRAYAGPFGAADVFNVYSATSLDYSNSTLQGVVGSGGNANL